MSMHSDTSGFPTESERAEWGALQRARRAEIMSGNPDVAPERTLCVIWSSQYRQWWRVNGAGYTPHLRGAGLFSTTEADQRTRNSRTSRALTLAEAFDHYGRPEPVQDGTVGAWVDANDVDDDIPWARTLTDAERAALDSDDSLTLPAAADASARDARTREGV